jgi:hypothetical protein
MDSIFKEVCILVTAAFAFFNVGKVVERIKGAFETNSA